MSTMVTERLVSISASLRDATRTLDGAAVEPCRTPTGILLARASPRVVRAMLMSFLRYKILSKGNTHSPSPVARL